MAKKSDSFYFGNFYACADCAYQAAHLLERVMRDFDPLLIREKLDDMHKVEHAADEKKHEVLDALVKAFITPIEREDIIELGQEIDNVTDSIEDVLMGVYMYNILSIRPEAIDFVDVIVQCCNGLKKTMEDFQNFRKSTTLHDSVVEINRLEEVGDRLYTEAVRNLYVNCKDPVEILAWTKIFDRMESCCDACEHVANVVESVMMKNS